jgi:hypothetical protein
MPRKRKKPDFGDDQIILGKRPGSPIGVVTVEAAKETRSKIRKPGSGAKVNPDSKAQKTKKARAEKRAKKPAIGGKGNRLQAGEKLEGNAPDLTLTPEVFKIIVDSVGRGNWRTVAAKMAGIPISTFQSWVRRGEQHLKEIEAGERMTMTIQANLVLDLAKAEGKLHDFHQSKILEEAKPELRFQWLTRRFAKEWVPTTTGIDDQTGEETQADLVALLLDRLKPLKESL